MAAIAMPQRRQQQDEKPESAIDTVLKGLSIAGSVYGLYADSQKLEMARKQEMRQQEAAQRERESFVAGKEESDIYGKGVMPAKDYLGGLKEGKFQEVAPGTEGALTLKVRQGGQDVDKTVLQSHVADINQRKAEIAAANKIKAAEMDSKVAKEKAEKEAEAEEKRFMRAGNLRSAYESNIITKNTYTKLNSFDDLMTIPSNRDKRTAAHDMKMVYSIMKIYEPSSSVKEGEYALAEQARGVPDSVRNVYNKLWAGGRLTDDQVTAFKKTALEGMAAQLKSQQLVDERYANIARKQNADVTTVISPEFDKIREELGLISPKGGKPTDRQGPALPATNAADLVLPKAEPTEEDRAALQWLQANPDDPRAPKIRESLKAKGLDVPTSVPARGMRLPRNKMG